MCRIISASGRAFLGLVIVAVGACSSDEGGGGAAAGSTGGPIFGGDLGPDFGTDPDDPDALGDACVGQTAGAESTPAVLQLVVDTSGSMDQDAPGSRDSKWTVTRSALLGAITQMPADTAIGVVFYPDVPMNAPTCFDNQPDVEIGRLERAGSSQRNRIQSAFSSQSPNGGTPTHDAYRYANAELLTTTAIGSRFSVVITDGTPTFSLGCEGTGLITDPVDPSPLVVEAADALVRGVRTFVIGSPGSEGARASLSRMAEAGGTASAGCSHTGPNYCHFDMTEKQDFASGLSEALGTISGLALSCSYDIPAPPSGAVLDPERVNVLFTPRDGARELIGKTAAGACSDGWQYSQNGSEILLCGSTCDRVRGSDGTLSLEFGCATQVR